MEKIRQRLEKFKQKQKGFTLVELIVVIAIIGILAAILLPKYFGFTDKARISAAVSDAKSIRSIAETYYAQNNVWPLVTSVGTTPLGKAGSAAFVKNGTATSILKVVVTVPPSTIDSPTFQGAISAYSTTAAYPPIAIIPTGKGLPADGSFNYTSNTGHTVKCDLNGTVTDID